MGDRNIPIKFGPEWLRNLSRERIAARASNSQNTNSGSGTSASTGSSGASGGATANNSSSGSFGASGAAANNSSTSHTGASSGSANNSSGGPPPRATSGSPANNASTGPSGASGGATANNAATGTSGASAGNTSNNSSSTTTNNSNGPGRVLLAKLRYGREEMLALYDRNLEAPQELKFIDTLYQARGKQPVALNNTFEDDVRDNLRSAPPIGGMSSGERYGLGRSPGRGIELGRGRPRFYVRQTSTGRGTMYHAGVPGPRPLYTGGADDESGPSRPWGNNSANSNNRSSGDQTDWATKMFRNKRPGNNTNWRQPQSRDDGEEWRSSESGRSRQTDNRDRDWGDRTSGDRPSSWSSSRRWVGGDNQNNEENLPEWAVENAECGGTFDSSGAFHGYSNDDNLPKHSTSHDPSYHLMRSNTHGGFSRPKVLEEGSEEWWASEKAKKLSPKRFDASDVKFKKQPGIGIADGLSTSTNIKPNLTTDAAQHEKQQKLVESQSAAAREPPEANATGQGDAFGSSAFQSNKFTESKTFEALMRSDIDLEEASDEGGNFQSVIINSNNSLRQKHQHLVPAMNEGSSSKQMPNMKGSIKNNKPEMDHSTYLPPEEFDKIFGMTLDDTDLNSTSSSNSLMTLSSSGMSAGITSAANAMPQNQNIQTSISNSTPSNQGMNMEKHLNKQNLQSGVVPPAHHTPGMQPLMEGLMNAGGMQPGIQSGMQPGIPSGMQPGIPSGMQAGLQMPGMPVGMQQTTNMQPGMSNPGYPSVQLQNMPGMASGGMQNMPGIQNMSGMQAPHAQTPGMQPVMQNVGITNSALNASLGLPIGPNMGHGLTLQGMPQQSMPNVCMANNSSMGSSGMNVMGASSLQGSGNISGFQSGSSMPALANNVGNASLFLGQNSNNSSMSAANEMPMSNHSGQNSLLMQQFGLQGSQGPYGNSMYANNATNLMDQWYYEDPERNIQGPFTSKDMYNWYRAGFFSPRLMVRRACETMMRPLGSYGPVVPFAPIGMMNTFPMSSGFERPQRQENILNAQALALDVMNMGNITDNTPMDLQFGSVGILANQSFGQPQPMVDSLWGQGSSSTTDLMWMPRSMSRADARVNNFFFWDHPSSAVNSNSLLPEEITKEMKTEDEILAQLRASQNIGQQSQPFLTDLQGPSPAASKPDDCYAPNVNATPNMEELHKLIQQETLTGKPSVPESNNIDTQPKLEKPAKLEQSSSDSSVTKSSSLNKSTVEPKQLKQAKESDKSTKNKENNNTKNKNKKTKEEKKDEVADIKTKEDEVVKHEKRSQEPSPSKNKKEDKSNKKDIEKEKKEWIKEGFTIVKGSEKNTSKDSKKKADEARVAEEAERKRKEEEKLAAEEEKKKKQAETAKKQQEQQAQQQQRQASESVVKKAPWSAVTNQAMQATNKDGLTLAEIQRLEREKKLEQMKEQQQMMQIIAQQQAAALAREQEMQAGLGWAKKKGSNQTQGQSLAEIQAEARKQAVAAAVAAAAKAMEESDPAPAPQTNHAPWATTHNGGNVHGGFWDTQPNSSKGEKQQESQKPAEQVKNKKKISLSTPSKKDTSPAIEFEAWCTSVLASWSSKIDVPTFVGFLKDIESPYEVKDYVKCYLGESKESSDFARQFLERRSKLLRVGMVTPSDDLCSPAIAVNPRTTSGSDYQEVKGKGKKAKKNKMLKVDVRILGFSVTASEDRINVGDIDTV